jgi:hypothetical protein
MDFCQPPALFVTPQFLTPIRASQKLSVGRGRGEGVGIGGNQRTSTLQPVDPQKEAREKRTKTRRT